MLYIWPPLAFFSAPLLLPSILGGVSRPIHYLRSVLSLTSKRATLLSLPYTLLTIILSLAVVKYNTIIHPFTLADNRHYMFYVFRYTILRSPTIRLSLVAAYTACRWVVWDQLAGPSHTTPAPPPPQSPKQQQPTTKPTAEPPTQITNPPSTTTALLWLLTTALSLITAPLVEPRYFILPWVFYRLLLPSSSSSSSRPPSSSPPTPSSPLSFP
jgi:alpha-1,2-glucosyltransferase